MLSESFPVRRTTIKYFSLPLPRLKPLAARCHPSLLSLQLHQRPFPFILSSSHAPTSLHHGQALATAKRPAHHRLPQPQRHQLPFRLFRSSHALARPTTLSTAKRHTPVASNALDGPSPSNSGQTSRGYHLCLPFMDHRPRSNVKTTGYKSYDTGRRWNRRVRHPFLERSDLDA